MSRRKWPQARCPKCGASGKELRHHVLEYWHECKKCGERFFAECSPHAHGLPVVKNPVKRDVTFKELGWITPAGKVITGEEHDSILKKITPSGLTEESRFEWAYTNGFVRFGYDPREELMYVEFRDETLTLSAIHTFLNLVRKVSIVYADVDTFDGPMWGRIPSREFAKLLRSRDWAKMKMEWNPVKPTHKWLAERLVSPKKFDSRSFRTIKRGDHMITVGCPRGKFHRHTQRCKVGLVAQRVLHPRRELGRLKRQGRVHMGNPKKVKKSPTYYYCPGCAWVGTLPSKSIGSETAKLVCPGCKAPVIKYRRLMSNPKNPFDEVTKKRLMSRGFTAEDILRAEKRHQFGKRPRKTRHLTSKRHREVLATKFAPGFTTVRRRYFKGMPGVVAMEERRENPFIMKMDTESDAFAVDKRQETARILRTVATDINEGGRIGQYRTAFDLNGNDVGRWRLNPAGGRGPKWRYRDATGVWREGYVEKVLDKGGTDITYFFRRDDDTLDVVSGSRLKEAMRLRNPYKKGNVSLGWYVGRTETGVQVKKTSRPTAQPWLHAYGPFKSKREADEVARYVLSMPLKNPYEVTSGTGRKTVFRKFAMAYKAAKILAKGELHPGASIRQISQREYDQRVFGASISRKRNPAVVPVYGERAWLQRRGIQAKLFDRRGIKRASVLTAMRRKYISLKKKGQSGFVAALQGLRGNPAHCNPYMVVCGSKKIVAANRQTAVRIARGLAKRYGRRVKCQEMSKGKFKVNPGTLMILGGNPPKGRRRLQPRSRK